MSQRLFKLWPTLGSFKLAVSVLWAMNLYPATAAEIGVVGAAAGGSGAHALTLVVEGPVFEWPIIVRRNDTGDSAVQVRVDVTPLTGPSAQLADPQRLLVNREAVGQGVLNLSSLEQAEVRLTGTLPVEGDFTGQLGIIVEGKRAPYDLKITRRKPANPPKVGFVGATSDGKLAMTSDRSAFEWPIILRRDDALKDEVEIKLHASLLSGPSGTIIHPVLLKDGKPLTEALKLGPLGEQSLMLTGKADLEGPHTGEISHEINGVRTPVTVTLTRTRPDFDLKIDTISKTRATAGDRSVKLHVRLLNTTSARREIYLPSIARLDRVDASGSTPVEVGTSGYTLIVSRPGGGSLPQPLWVDGDASLDLQVAIEGLDAPGTYKGVMRFTAPDRKVADSSFELALRLCWPWAALAIGLGVIIAAGLRFFQQTGQPRLLVQRDALDLRAKLTTLLQAESGDLAPRERQVIALLIGQLDDASDQLADTNTAIETVAATIAAVRRKLPLLTPWITFRRRHDALRPPSVAATIEPDLNAVFNTLMNAQATEAQITAAQNTLDGLDTKINNAIKDHITAACTVLRDAIAEFEPAERLEFNQVSGDLDTATTEANLFHFTEATAALARARSKFAETAAGLLRAALTTANTAVGFSPVEWTALVTEIVGLLDAIGGEPDPDQRVQLWTKANRRYLVEVVRRAKARIDELIEADVPDTKDALTLAQAKLVEAQTELAAGHLGAARTAYRAAIVAANPARAVLLKQGQRLGKDPNADTNAPNAGADVPSAIIVTAIGGLLPLRLGRDVTLAQVQRSLRTYSVVFAAVILVLAVLSGLQLLYVPNPAFSWGDMIVAFLWGAGLHAVAGQTFQGLAGLAQKFR